MKNYTSSSLVLLLVGFLAVSTLPAANQLFDFSSETPQSLFLDPIELRKKELEKRNAFAAEFKKRSVEAQSAIIRRVNAINGLIIEADAASSNVTNREKDYLNKKLSKLNERKQVLITIQENWIRVEEIVQNHLRLLSEMVEEFGEKTPFIEKKLVYSLTDERLLQSKVTELADKISSERFKYDGLLKQRKAEEDALTFIQKDIEAHKKDQKKIIDKTLQSTRFEKQESFRHEAELLEIAFQILDELKELSKITLERLDSELYYKKDEIGLLEIRLEALKKAHTMVDARLYIDKGDISTAIEEAEKEKQVGLENKNRWNRQRTGRRNERERLKAQFSLLDERLKQIKTQGQEEHAHSQIISAAHKKIETNILALDKELELLTVRKELEDEHISLKTAQVKIVEIRYRLQTKNFEKNDLDKWMNEFSKEFKREESDIRSLEEKRSLISNRLTEGRRASDAVNVRINEVREQKNSIFRDDATAFNEVLVLLSEAKAFLERDMQFNQEHFLLCSELIRYKNDANKHYKMIIGELDKKRQFDIWKRSTHAIPLEGFWQSLFDAEEFLKDFFWRLPSNLSPLLLFKMLTRYNIWDFIGILLLLALFFLLFAGMRFLLQDVRERVGVLCERSGERAVYPLYRLFQIAVAVIVHAYPLLFVWFFAQLDIIYNFKHFFWKFGEFIFYTDSPYLVTCFYLFFIPVLVVITERFVKAFADLNIELNYPFFSQALQEHYISLLKLGVYASIILIQLRQATLVYMKGESYLPIVIFASYTLILQLMAIFLLLIHKDHIMAFFNPGGHILQSLKEVIDKQYRPVVSFVALLLVLSNPYVGYSNLAFLLSYAVPVSIVLGKFLFIVHSFVRKNVAVWFISQEDDEAVDRFEHAKTYYGIFIILSFIVFAFITLLAIARVWNISSSLSMISELLAQKWTIDIGNGNRFGVVQFLILIIFIATGFFASRLIDTFVLNKIFDILQLDFGLRNTASSLSHYIVIFMAVILGFTAIQLGNLVMWASGGVLLAIGFGAKDFISDFIAGFLVLLERPLEVGSYIQIPGTVGTHTSGILGTVYKISARSTTIRTVNNYFIVIPNKDLINKPIINWGYGRSTVGFEINFAIEYEANIKEVLEALSEVISAESRILRSPTPTYRLDGFNAHGLHFFVRAFISSRRVREQWDIASDVRFSLLRVFDKHHIRIAYPHSIVHSQKEIRDEVTGGSHQTHDEPIQFKFDT